MLANKTLELVSYDGGQQVEVSSSMVPRMPTLSAMLTDTGYQSVRHHVQCTSSGLLHALWALMDGGQSLSTSSMIAAVPSAEFTTAKTEAAIAEADLAAKELECTEVRKTIAEKEKAAGAVVAEAVAELDLKISQMLRAKREAATDAQPWLDVKMSRLTRAKREATGAAKVDENKAVAAVAAQELI
jgi:hypothetical protein